MADRAEQLIEEGYGLLEEEEFKKALKVAGKLRRLRNTGGFEIGARALWGLGKWRKAIALLEDGVKKGPSVHSLWDYLGNYLSDMGEYDKALDAYRRASWCPSADHAMDSYNISVVLYRQKRFDESLAIVERCKQSSGGPCHPAWDALQAWTLNALGRYSETLQLVDPVSANDDVDEKWVKAVADLEACKARAVWESRRDRDEVLRLAWSALNRCKDCHEASDLVREVADLRTKTSRSAWVMVTGRAADFVEILGCKPIFHARYRVIFDSPAEALEFIKPYEDEESRESLRIEEIFDEESCPDVPKGVYEAYAVYYTSLEENHVKASRFKRRLGGKTPIDLRARDDR